MDRSGPMAIGFEDLKPLLENCQEFEATYNFANYKIHKNPFSEDGNLRLPYYA